MLSTRTALGQLVRKGIYAPTLQNWLNNYPSQGLHHDTMVINYRDLHRNERLASEVYFRILDFVVKSRMTTQLHHHFVVRVGTVHYILLGVRVLAIPGLRKVKITFLSITKELPNCVFLLGSRWQ
jgi:hypothetical protein